jgi:hypothetical protein
MTVLIVKSSIDDFWDWLEGYFTTRVANNDHVVPSMFGDIALCNESIFGGHIVQGERYDEHEAWMYVTSRFVDEDSLSLLWKWADELEEQGDDLPNMMLAGGDDTFYWLTFDVEATDLDRLEVTAKLAIPESLKLALSAVSAFFDELLAAIQKRYGTTEARPVRLRAKGGRPKAASKKDRWKLVQEWERKQGRQKQEIFAQLHGITDRTLREYITEFESEGKLARTEDGWIRILGA